MPTDEPAELPPDEDLPTNLAEAAEWAEDAGEAVSPDEPPSADFIGTRRQTDEDTGSRVTLP